MKIGKPKSKRVPVRLRHKIEKASTAKQRKQRKEAKKNPQWRSRLKKDPGVPNLFPYKAKVLAEIEESKRRKEEEAQNKRDLAKAQRQGRAVASAEPSSVVADAEEDSDDLIDDGEDIDEDEDMSEQDNSNPMAALLASAQARADAYTLNDDEETEDEEEEEWNGIEDTNPTIKSAQLQQKGLPKQALEEPIKAVSKLLDRVQDTSGGIQILLDFYEILPLVTAGSDLSSRFLVEVARKRGRLGKGGIPNLHSAALTVLGDVHEGRLVIPAAKAKTIAQTGKGEVQVVQELAQPFIIEGLWGDGEGEEEMAVEAG